MSNEKQPTIVDVAKKARVAISTVSRVLNGTSYTSEATREKVLKACEELNYIPNFVAGSLKRKKTGVIALLVPDMTNPFWPLVAKGIEEVIKKAGYHLILSNTAGKLEEEIDNLEMLLKRRVDGIICATIHDRHEIFEKVKSVVPMVIVGKVEMDIDMVYVNSVKGGFIGTEYLLNQNHRKIAFIGGPADGVSFKDRIKGYRTALESFEIQYNSNLVLVGKSVDYLPALNEIKELLKQEPTAVLCLNDLIAMKTWSHAEDLGIRVGEDLSIMGFDNSPYSQFFKTGLSSVAQPVEERGRISARLLIERIENNQAGDFQRVILQPELVIRNSICKI
ncbi:LacI family DNA-binding transcriptional regulator [Metabacillus sp. SLBN-84]